MYSFHFVSLTVRSSRGILASFANIQLGVLYWYICRLQYPHPDLTP